MLLPHLRDNSEVELVSVATTKSLSGLNAQRKFGFATITTSVETVLDDDTLDAVFIVTRHHSHAGLVCEALKRGRAVFVEKPLALSEDQLAHGSGNGRTRPATTESWSASTGGSHRSSRICETASAPFRGPLSARYLVNAGRLDPSSWYLNEELEGSRFAGEGGHFIDTLSALVGHDPVEVQAMAAGANIHATLRFSDESVATISYVTDGSPRFPKETLDVVGRWPDRTAGQFPAGHRVVVQGKDRTADAHRPGQGAARAAGALRRRCPHRLGHADPARVPRGDYARNSGSGPAVWRRAKPVTL